MRPVIVLPAEMAARMPRAELQPIVAHELAHVLRRDNLVGLLQRVAAAVYWPHPLVHRLNRALSRTREEVCDNYALAAGERHEYARTLVAVAERAEEQPSAAWAVGLLDPRWKLEERIAGLLDGARNLRRSAGPARLTAIFATALAAVLVLGGTRTRLDRDAAIARIEQQGGQVTDEGRTITIPAGWQGSRDDLRAVNAIPDLQQLRLVGAPVEELELHDLPELKSLEVEQAAEGPQGARLPLRRVRLANLPKLTQLFLSGTEVGSLELRDMPGLDSIEIYDSPAGDDVLRSLAGAPNLRKLEIGSSYEAAQDATRLTPAGLAVVAGMPRLERLGLWQGDVDDAGLRALSASRSLQELWLQSPGITDAGLTVLKDLPSLTKAIIVGPQITDKGLRTLLALNNNQWIRVAGTAITPEGLVQVREAPQLTAIQLEPRHLTPETCEALGALPNLQILFVLDGGDQPGTVRGLDRLPALYLEDVERLTFEPDSLAGVERLIVAGSSEPVLRALFDQLPRMSKLKGIEMRPGETGAYPPGVVDDRLLGKLSNAEQLEFLWIQRATEIGDEGLAHLAGLKNLRGLLLNRSQVTDAGVTHLSGLTNLKRLYVDDSRLTNAAVDRLLTLTSLEELIVRGTKIDEEGAARLREALPDADIQFGDSWGPPRD